MKQVKESPRYKHRLAQMVAEAEQAAAAEAKANGSGNYGRRGSKIGLRQ